MCDSVRQTEAKANHERESGERREPSVGGRDDGADKVDPRRALACRRRESERTATGEATRGGAVDRFGRE